MQHNIDLSEGWSFSSKNQLFSGKVDLPNSNYTALIDSGMMNDPFFAKNDANSLWVAELDWIYQKTFSAAEDMLNAEYVSLEFDSIDTIADVCLNGKHIGYTSNAFLRYTFDIKEHLKQGENEIQVYLHSPVRYVKQKQRLAKMPPNASGINGFSLIRKPAYHFGWDWAPILPPSGIEGGVRLLYGKGAKIQTISTTQGFIKDAANLTVNVSCLQAGADTDIRCVLYCPVGEPCAEGNALPFSEKKGVTDFKLTMLVPSPELWYANGMLERKEQPLYTLTAEIWENGQPIEKKSLKVGFREIKLSTEPDNEGQDFCFIVNGSRIFAKGANWVPPDCFRTPVKKLEKLIKCAVRSNFNMLRVWGGGYYASEEFLDLCDKYGILVWHDFQFACAPYPFYDKNFLRSAIEEAKQQIVRLRNRACLALFCGNNEIEQMSAAWAHRRKLNAQNKYFFHKTLPSLVMRYSDIDYWASSPSSGVQRVTKSDAFGDTHIWATWHGMKSSSYYLKRKTRFCSEFGFESLPDMDTIKGFVNSEKDLNLHSSVMKAHQKCMSGNDRIIYYMIKNYRMPNNFFHLIYLSQLMQAESVAAGVEFWRRNMGRCNGALYWQFNDCWPATSWSSIDYNGNHKALQYFAKEFFRPVQPSVVIKKGQASVFVANDSLTDYHGLLRYRLADFDGGIVFYGEKEILVPAYSAAEETQVALDAYIKKSDYKDMAFIAELVDKDGEVSATTNTLLVKERDARLKKAEISFDVEESPQGFAISISSDTYARRVMLWADGLNAPFSKNFFDIEAGTTHKVMICKDCGLSLEELKEKLKFTSFADIVPQHTVWKERAIKLRISLMAINLINRIIYSFN
ncbi:MAG: glycoside hydrolase family 2 protein [Clostridia bacterium]